MSHATAVVAAACRAHDERSRSRAPHRGRRLRLIADVGVLLAKANHDGRVARATYNGGEDSAESAVAGKTDLGR